MTLIFSLYVVGDQNVALISADEIHLPEKVVQSSLQCLSCVPQPELKQVKGSCDGCFADVLESG